MTLPAGQEAPKPRYTCAPGRSPGFRIILLVAPSQGLRPEPRPPTPVACHPGACPQGLATFVPGHGCGPAPDLHRTSRFTRHTGTWSTLYIAQESGLVNYSVFKERLPFMKKTF